MYPVNQLMGRDRIARRFTSQENKVIRYPIKIHQLLSHGDSGVVSVRSH